MKLLFIDDDDLRTRSLREGLESIGGFDVEFIQEIDEALEFFKENIKAIDVVTLDIMMPHKDIPEYKKFVIKKYFSNNKDGTFTGLKLMEQIHEIMENEKLKIPFIILSVVPRIELYVKELSAKPAKFLKKPIGPRKLTEEVNDVLRKKISKKKKK